eukprot:SAG31_NODE_48219_length_197_cov_24.244898_1_plen_25_part_10
MQLDQALSTATQKPPTWVFFDEAGW